MREAAKKDWLPFNPHTNCLWLSFLVLELRGVHCRRLRQSEYQELRALQHRLFGTVSCQEALKDEFWRDVIRWEVT